MIAGRPLGELAKTNIKEQGMSYAARKEHVLRLIHPQYGNRSQEFASTCFQIRTSAFATLAPRISSFSKRLFKSHIRRPRRARAQQCEQMQALGDPPATR